MIGFAVAHLMRKRRLLKKKELFEALFQTKII
ncbi:hypothetical protein B14911_11592 [Bacillus sp. NRRL B-14911]|nr:hypothetical protein B14911_11592 [Bacillus sp. NRRL B-14911]